MLIFFSSPLSNVPFEESCNDDTKILQQLAPNRNPAYYEKPSNMILKSLTLENFKGISSPQTIEFKPITLLFGPNSAGKSTVLQSLAYLYEILERGNVDAEKTEIGGETMELGGFESLVHNHDRDKEITICLAMNVENEDLSDYLTDEEWYLIDSAETRVTPASVLSYVNEISFVLKISWSPILNRPITSSLRIDANGLPIVLINHAKDGKDTKIAYIETQHPVIKGSNEYITPEEFNKKIMEESKKANEKLDRILDDEHSSDENSEDDDSFFIILHDCSREEYYIPREIGETKTLGLGNIPIHGLDGVIPPRDKRLQFDANTWTFEYGTPSTFPLGFETLITSVLSGLVVGPIDMVRRELENLIYLGPLRNVPDRHYVPTKSEHFQNWADGTAAWNVLARADDSLIREINDWMTSEDKFNMDYELNLKKYYELPVDHPISVSIQTGQFLDEDASKELLSSLHSQTRPIIQDKNTGLEVSPKDVGTGISQLLPVIIASIFYERGNVAIEQPELHIHPRLQVVLGDLFLSYIDAPDKLFLIETHSEYLMLRLLRRIRETYNDELPPDAPVATSGMVSICYVEHNDEQTLIKPLRIDETGEFSDNWPQGFFEERAEELF